MEEYCVGKQLEHIANGDKTQSSFPVLHLIHVANSPASAFFPRNSIIKARLPNSHDRVLERLRTIIYTMPRTFYPNSNVWRDRSTSKSLGKQNIQTRGINERNDHWKGKPFSSSALEIPWEIISRNQTSFTFACLCRYRKPGFRN